jgi:hypothetical protein
MARDWTLSDDDRAEIGKYRKSSRLFVAIQWLMATFGEVESVGPSTRKMARAALRNSAIFSALSWRGTRGKTSKLPRFTKIGQEPIQ